MNNTADRIRDWVLSVLAIIAFFLQWILPAFSVYLIGAQVLIVISALGALLLLGIVWHTTFSVGAKPIWKYLLIVVSVCTFAYSFYAGYQLRSEKDTNILSWSLSSQLSYVAWNAYKSPQQYETAISMADLCINLYDTQALGVQARLTSILKTPYPDDVIKDPSIIAEIKKNYVLNDVAACYWIKGQSLENLKNIPEAIIVYDNLAANYSFARVYDPTWNSYYSPSALASERLVVLQTP